MSSQTVCKKSTVFEISKSITVESVKSVVVKSRRATINKRAQTGITLFRPLCCDCELRTSLKMKTTVRIRPYSHHITIMLSQVVRASVCRDVRSWNFSLMYSSASAQFASLVNKSSQASVPLSPPLRARVGSETQPPTIACNSDSLKPISFRTYTSRSSRPTRTLKSRPPMPKDTSRSSPYPKHLVLPRRVTSLAT